jgi:hypothetical protein
MGFRKIKDLKLAKSASLGKAQVFEAIKDSETIMADGPKHIRRKLPFGGKLLVEAAPTSYGKEKPTGFEDSFADQPITPQEFEQEREMYSL